MYVGSEDYSLSQVLRQRRWQVCTWPFVHYCAQDVFTPEFYTLLDAAFGELLGRDLAEEHDSHRFSRNMKSFDAYALNFDAELPQPLRIFCSRAWHDMLAQVADIPATGDVVGGFHHHLKGSRSGSIHNDLNPGWFVNSSSPGAVNLSRHDLCEYSTGHVYRAEVAVHESVRALAVLFFLHNPVWREGDGGQTGLYVNSAQSVIEPSKAVAPINNSIFMFECTPHSYHSFISNRNHFRNSMIMWLHRPKGDAIQRWGDNAIVEWSGKTQGQPR